MISREMRLKEKLDKEVKQLQVDMEAKLGEIKALNVQGQRAKEEQQRLEQQLRELKVSRRGTVTTIKITNSVLHSGIFFYYRHRPKIHSHVY